MDASFARVCGRDARAHSGRVDAKQSSQSNHLRTARRRRHQLVRGSQTAKRKIHWHRGLRIRWALHDHRFLSGVQIRWCSPSDAADHGPSMDVDSGGHVPRGLCAGYGSAEWHLRAVRHVRWFAHSHLRYWLHAWRPRLLSLLRLSEPVHVRDADPGAGRQFSVDVRRLGRRRALFLPADRLLSRQR